MPTTGLKHPASIKLALDQLAGPGRYVGGVWVWDVRYIR
jgi:hypothetical protein